MDPTDLSGEAAKALVRAGYNALSYHYRSDDYADTSLRGGWLDRLTPRLDPGAAVLDLGCGCGLPVAHELTIRGYRVTGVDLSDTQIDRARRLVPGATFLRADAATLDLPTEAFDAIVCLYMLIHLLLDEQPGLLARMQTWLRPGGILLATTGHRAWTGTEDNWHDGGATMWWSHADAATYRGWLTDAGLVVEAEEFVPEGDGGHALFWAVRPTSPPSLVDQGFSVVD